MCGIFGIVARASDETPPEALLYESAERIRHRGPDAQGVYAQRGIGVASTRLALVDLDPRSNQPFWDEGGRYGVAFNGEIYNFRELRERLESDGVAFRTSGDTEVLLQCLIHAPDTAAAIRSLEGMFGFAFYDREKDTLVLARDRFGMKPLYVYEDSDTFAFGSEIKTLRPWIDLDADRFSIASYLLGFGGPTKGCTFYRGLRSVPPGGMVTLRRGEPADHSRFFALPDFLDADEMAELDAMTPRAIVDRMDEQLYTSVEKHMFADAKVGAFCSGGVDSSLLMAMAARQHDDLAIFHANVKGRWSEHHAASALAKHLGLEMQTVDVEEQDFVDWLPRVMWHYEHPYTYHPNSAPLMMVAQLARDSGVKGLLSGEGSDECFLGYPWLGRKRIEDAYHRFGRRLRSLVHGIPAVGKILWPYEGDGAVAVRDLLNRREIRDDEDSIREAAEALGGARVERHNITSLDYMHYHLRTLLHRNDSMGMAASIEARFPFLDHRVVKTAVNMPARYKLRFSPTVLEKAHPFIRDKWVVRKVADRYIPRGLSQRIKIGFWTTVFQRMTVAPRYFDDSFVRELFELTPAQMRRVVDDADQDLSMRLLHLDVWGRVCFEEAGEDGSRDKLRDHVTIRAE